MFKVQMVLAAMQEWGLDVAKSSFLSGLPWAISFALANLVLVGRTLHSEAAA